MEDKSWRQKFKQFTNRRTLSTSQLASIAGLGASENYSNTRSVTLPRKSVDAKAGSAYDTTKRPSQESSPGLSISERTLKILLHLKIAVFPRSNLGSISLRDVSGDCGVCWSIESWRANVKGCKFILVQSCPVGSELQAFCSSVSALRFAIKLVIEHRISAATSNFERQRLSVFKDWSCASAVVLQCAVNRSLHVSGDYSSWCKELCRRDRDHHSIHTKSFFNINTPLMIDVNSYVCIEEKGISLAYDTDRAVRLSCLCRTGISGMQEPLLLINFSGKTSPEPVVNVVKAVNNDVRNRYNYGGTTSVFFLG